MTRDEMIIEKAYKKGLKKALKVISKRNTQDYTKDSMCLIKEDIIQDIKEVLRNVGK